MLCRLVSRLRVIRWRRLRRLTLYGLRNCGGLTTEGNCEFVGSGYSQIIGPLVPAEVNGANLRLGNQVYEKMLGFRPDIALVNEQAYSAGLVQHSDGRLMFGQACARGGTVVAPVARTSSCGGESPPLGFCLSR